MHTQTGDLMLGKDFLSATLGDARRFLSEGASKSQLRSSDKPTCWNQLRQRLLPTTIQVGRRSGANTLLHEQTL
jgi:hypothetical protein